MKAIIYTGIGLFAAASIYGMVDFAATKKKGTMEKMYKEEAVAAPEKETVVPDEVIPTKEITSNNVTNETAAKTSSKKIKRQKTFTREIKFSDFSRGRIAPKEVKEIKLEEPVIKEQ